MAKVKIDKLSLKELLKLRGELDTAIAAAEKAERASALKAAKDAAAKHGFSLKDLVGGDGPAAKTASAPKYRHPENSAVTWSGRGRKPEWFKVFLESGKKAEDLLIS